MKIIPPNNFWSETTLNQEMMDYIWSQIKLAEIDYKPFLQGHITSSLDLPDTENKLCPAILEAAKELNHIYYENQNIEFQTNLKFFLLQKYKCSVFLYYFYPCNFF